MPLRPLVIASLITLISSSPESRADTSSARPADWPGCGVVDVYPGADWPVAQAGPDWDLDALAQARARFDESDADSVMIIHRGHPIAAWGAVADPVTIQSMRKPLLGGVIAQMIAEDRLDPDATLEEMGIIDSDPALTPAEQQVTLRELMLIRSGIMHDANYEHGSWRARRIAIREQMPDDLRGRWFYNNWDFNVLGTIVQRAAESDLGSLVDAYLARPLGMQDFEPASTTYSDRHSLAQQHFGYGSDYPAYMFEMSSRDMARFGLLYLGCGRWQEDQLIDRDWVEESLTGRDTYEGWPEDIVTGFDQYGYLWWIENGGAIPRFAGLEAFQPFYGASGARGHFTLILPRYDLVIVHQPRSLGGISDEGQIHRARNGSPQVSGADFQALVQAILRAHPDG